VCTFLPAFDATIRYAERTPKYNADSWSKFSTHRFAHGLSYSSALAETEHSTDESALHAAELSAHCAVQCDG
jgi:hypothetical protein